MAAYAELDDFEAYYGSSAPDADAEAAVTRMLARASELLDDHLRTAIYAIDEDDGLPTDTDVADALKNAACAQVEFWFESGEEHDVDGLAGTEVSIAGYSGTRPQVLAPRAARFLRSAGLYETDPVRL